MSTDTSTRTKAATPAKTPSARRKPGPQPKPKVARPLKAPGEKKKPGPKPILGRKFTGAEKQARRKARITEVLQQAIDEARAARGVMERLAEESSRALAELEQVPGMAEARSRQEQAFEAAGKVMTALENALGVRGDLLAVKVA